MPRRTKRDGVDATLRAAGILDPPTRPEISIPSMRVGFERVIESVFDIDDIEIEFRGIEESLKFDGAGTPDSLQQASLRAEESARRAFKLQANAKVELDSHSRNCDQVEASMLATSLEKLEGMKASGKITKAISEAMVIREASLMFPDDWQRLQARRVRAKEMVRYLESLAVLCKGRCYTLSNMLNPQKGSL